MLNIGIRAHDITNDNLPELAEKLKNKGIQYIQLALLRSVKEFEVSQRTMNVGMAREIGNIFAKKDVNIAVLGCYINMIHPEADKREEALDFFKTHVMLAREFGASVVGTETGAVTAEVQYTEGNFNDDAFNAVVESVKELVSEAERQGALVAIEGGINHPIYAPKMMKRLIEEIKSNNMQVILDPVNYLFPEDMSKEAQHKIVDDAFDLFGDRITIIHAKDFKEENGEKVIVPVGQGEFDYAYLMKKLKEQKPGIPVLLEETQEPHIDKATNYLKNLYDQGDNQLLKRH